MRLQELKQNTFIFGVVNLLVFGDLMQLPPVSATRGAVYCLQQPENFAAEARFMENIQFLQIKLQYASG